ncbi:hypothetical protein AAC387_Pa01g2561 [Persea americana]
MRSSGGDSSEEQRTHGTGGPLPFFFLFGSRFVTGKTMPCCVLLPPRPRKWCRRPAKVRAAVASLSSPSLFSFSSYCTE